MAKGNERPCVKCYVAFALIAVVILAATNVFNPFPGIWDWVNRSQPLSEPDVVWQQRLGGTPKSVTITGNTVIVEHRTTVESLSLETGVRIWERKADWAAVAGGALDPVVVTGKLLTKGYQVLDPGTGAVRRRDEAAVAVWTWRNALLDVRCARARVCTLSAWDPRGSAPLWSAHLPGIRAGLFADNPELMGTRQLTADRVEPAAGGPELMPSLLGFPVDDRVYIVDTATGRVVQDVRPEESDRIAVVGGRLLRIEARSADGTCYFTVTARDPATGQQVWRRAGINLRTADGAGCFQRSDPQGGRNVLVGVAPDTRETVLNAYDGRLLWVGAPGEKLLAVDDRYAMARAADKKGIASWELGREAPRWSRPTDERVDAALTRYAAIVVDREPDRIIALDPATGRELATLHSPVDVLAVGPYGMVIGEGRDIGYVRWSGPGIAPPGQPAGPGTSGQDPAPAPGSAAPTCSGPKLELCQPKDPGGAG